MIGIDINNYGEVKKDFYAFLYKFLNLDNTIESEIEVWIREAQDLKDDRLVKMYQFYKKNWTRISEIDSLEGLWNINDEFNLKFFWDIIIWGKAKSFITTQKSNPSIILKKNTSFGRFRTKMETLYKDFFNKKVNGYENIGEWLAEKLNIECCPFCNRHYTFTILKNKKHATIRPQFDHFLPKSKFPLIAVCYYNLVPVCPDCNKLKGSNILTIHPYEDSFDKHGIKFGYDPISDRRNLKITLSDENNDNVEKLSLIEIYQKHSEIATDLINKAESYNASYYDSLITSFSGLCMTPDEIDRAIWGVALDKKTMLKRPFSKFTRDIISQFGIYI